METNSEKLENGKVTKKTIIVREFDDLFKYIGGVGPFQVCHIFLIGLLAFLGTDSLYINFFGADTEHWCREPELENLPFTLQKYISIPDANSEDSSYEYATCEMFALNYSKYELEDYLTWNRSAMTNSSTKTISCKNGWVYNRNQFASTIVTRWDLVCEDSWMIELLSTLIIAGFGVGSVISGELSDRFGRKTTLVLLNLVKIGAGYLHVWAPTYEVMAIARVLIGAGGNGSYIAAYVLMAEITDPYWRPFFSTVGSISYSLGYMLVPGIAYAIRDYQWMLFVGPCLALIPISYWWIVPESARWLVAKGKKAEAEKTLRKIAAINGYTWPENIDLEPLYQKQNEKTAEPKKRNPLDLFKSSAMLRSTLTLYFLWFSVSLIYYALSLNSGSLAGDIFLNTFLLGAIELPASILNIVFLTKGLVGRRTLACATLMVAGAASFISIPLILDGSQETITVVLAILGKGAATMAFGVIYVLATEVFPTEYRNIGLGTSSLAARISGMGAPYVGGMLQDVWQPLPFLIYGIFGTSAGLLAFLLPETRGAKLPQTIEDVELFSRSQKKRKAAKKSMKNGIVNQSENTYL